MPFLSILFIVILALIPFIVLYRITRLLWNYLREYSLGELWAITIGIAFFLGLLLIVGVGTGLLPAMFGLDLPSVQLDKNGQPEGCVNNYMGSIDC